MSVSGFERDWLLDPHQKPLEARPFGIRASLGLGASALVILVGFWLISGRSGGNAPVASPTPGETASPAASVQFDLRAPEFAGLVRAVATSDVSGARIDSLTIGQFAPNGAYARFDIRQASGDARANPEFAIDLAREATEAGLKVVKIGQPAPFATRFGAFEVADARLSGKSPAGLSLERDCQTLRLAGSKQGVAIAGVVCAAPGQTLDRRALACLVDQLSFRSNGAAVAADKLFLLADPLLRGAACAQGPAASEKADWMTAHSAPPAAQNAVPPTKISKKAH